MRSCPSVLCNGKQYSSNLAPSFKAGQLWWMLVHTPELLFDSVMRAFLCHVAVDQQINLQLVQLCHWPLDLKKTGGGYVRYLC